MRDCIFCKIINGKIPAEKLYEDKDTFIFLDINPNTPGHSLIISKKHFRDFLDTPDDVLCKMTVITKKFTPKIIKSLGAEGFNIGVNTGKVAGQVVEHVHFHIIPRFSGDGLVHWRAQKTSPEKLKKIAEKIRKETVK